MIPEWLFGRSAVEAPSGDFAADADRVLEAAERAGVTLTHVQHAMRHKGRSYTGAALVGTGPELVAWRDSTDGRRGLQLWAGWTDGTVAALDARLTDRHVAREVTDRALRDALGWHQGAAAERRAVMHAALLRIVLEADELDATLAHLIREDLVLPTRTRALADVLAHARMDMLCLQREVLRTIRPVNDRDVIDALFDRTPGITSWAETHVLSSF